MSSKVNGTDVSMSDWARAPPPTGPLWARIATVIYNPRENSILGRTPKRWGIVLAFYLVFYAVLALLFALCMGGLFLTLDYSRPKYTLERSLIGVNPGIAYRPQPLKDVIRYDRSNSSRLESYIIQLEEFLSVYAKESWFESAKGCKAEDSYGYPDTPCVFVKLNKIYEWQPDLYDDADELPGDMPADLVQTITDAEPAARKQVWVSCSEEDGNSTGFEYPWGRGLPAAFYPYRNEEGYKSPLIAVRIMAPVRTLITIRCRVWAKNIVFNKSIKEASGYTRIQFYIEDKENSKSTQDGNL